MTNKTEIKEDLESHFDAKGVIKTQSGFKITVHSIDNNDLIKLMEYQWEYDINIKRSGTGLSIILKKT